MSASPSKVVLFLLLAGLGASVSCSKGDAKKKTDPGSGVTSLCDLPESCKQIVQACMPKDDGTPGAVHDCHITGMEEGIKASCDRDLSGCVTTCTAAPSLGTPEDVFAGCGDASSAEGGPLTFPASALSTFMSDGGDLSIELRTAPYQPIHVGPEGEGQLRITSHRD